ncbi:MAG: methyltransferase domain-containing protein [Candidatus Eisenbacteria bacterium]|uniref:Methyltransferase domain-containing protein n=1 Tax=Eiseniibacteriota bacterium TaxID=2212470 RepID=A0A7Y2EA20_UNCEI|nr:methyltransferase domain-containing protein [Candidatus Eisenbacteria bacterium]
MTDYLSFKTDLTNPEVADTVDDFPYWSSMFGQLLFRHLRLRPGLRALDIGCGTGFPLLELADRLGPSSEVFGVDAWDHAVARARLKARVRGNENVRVKLGDASELPFEDGYFDLIVSNLGLNNFEAPAKVMAECRRVCKPGARLALTTNLVGHMSEFYQTYEASLRATGLDHLVGKLQSHVDHRATQKGLHSLYEGAGFEITKFHTETFTLRYADGSAFLHAYLSRLGFLDGWRGVLENGDQEASVFRELESRLNQAAGESGEGLPLSIPAAYVEGRSPTS